MEEKKCTGSQRASGKGASFRFLVVFDAKISNSNFTTKMTCTMVGRLAELPVCALSHSLDLANTMHAHAYHDLTLTLPDPKCQSLNCPLTTYVLGLLDKTACPASFQRAFRLQMNTPSCFL